ncbi:MAG: 3-dehydroquinate synthase [Bacteroidota bacterium]
MQSLDLSTYQIHVGDIWQKLEIFLKDNNYSQHIVIVDENTEKYCWPILQEKLSDVAFEIIKIPAGELYKHIGTCQEIWAQMMNNKVDRKALCINLGGGVIGDMGGFCASTYKRGIDFIQMPTTLLSQVDASIGSKLGIDFMQIKNSIGLFKDPKAVFIDPIFYNTLSPRELRSGFAEVIKHSLINDAEQWATLSKFEKLNEIDWNKHLIPSLKIKQRIVEEDPFEKGLRKALNFGHTIGHAVEGFALETDTPLLHGEAIAIGMICETFLSHVEIGLSEIEVVQISRFILNIYGHHPLSSANYEIYLKLMQNDKKNEGAQINFSLIPKIGKVKVNCTSSQEQILRSFEFYNDLASVLA